MGNSLGLDSCANFFSTVLTSFFCAVRCREVLRHSTSMIGWESAWISTRRVGFLTLWVERDYCFRSRFSANIIFPCADACGLIDVKKRQVLPLPNGVCLAVFVGNAILFYVVV